MEELRLILESLETMGESALEFAVWYLAVQSMKALLLFAFGLTAILSLYRLIAVGVRLGSQRACALVAVCEELGYRPATYDGGWHASETNQLVKRIASLKSAASDTQEQQRDGG